MKCVIILHTVGTPIWKIFDTNWLTFHNSFYYVLSLLQRQTRLYFVKHKLVVHAIEGWKLALRGGGPLFCYMRDRRVVKSKLKWTPFWRWPAYKTATSLLNQMSTKFHILKQSESFYAKFTHTLQILGLTASNLQTFFSIFFLTLEQFFLTVR